MKQKKLKTDFIIPKSLALIFLTIASLFYFGGCARAPSITRDAYQYAKEKASPENCEYLKIKTVVSAVKQENGDISVCVELNTPNGTEEPKLNTITLPLAALTGEKTAVDLLGLRLAECLFTMEQIHKSEDCWFDDEGWLHCPGDEYTDAACFWYPIEKSKNGCETVSPGSLSSTSVVPIERLEVHNKDRNQLYDLLDSYNKNQQITEKIYEVSFVFDEADTEKDTNNDIVLDKPILIPDEMVNYDAAMHEQDTTKDAEGCEVIDNREKDTNDVWLIYWPAQIGQQGVQAISIAGAYKDNSTDLYYLAVPAAFVGDVVIYSIAIMIAPYLAPFF